MSRSAAPPGSTRNNCQSCHNVPVLGGAGDFTANAFISEGFESADFDTLDPQFSNERGSVSLFGDGLVELLAREMTRGTPRRARQGGRRCPRERPAGDRDACRPRASISAS